jgi:hypothetical protein
MVLIRLFLLRIARTGKALLKLSRNHATEDPIAAPIKYRAALLESFYDKCKFW